LFIVKEPKKNQNALAKHNYIPLASQDKNIRGPGRRGRGGRDRGRGRGRKKKSDNSFTCSNFV
jgi:hypothetical protein